MKLRDLLILQLSAQVAGLTQTGSANQSLLEKILMSQAELKTRIDGMTAQVQKSRAEIQAAIDKAMATATELQAKIQELIESGNQLDPALVDSVDRLQSEVQAVDDLNPDPTAPVDPAPVDPDAPQA